MNQIGILTRQTIQYHIILSCVIEIGIKKREITLIMVSTTKISIVTTLSIMYWFVFFICLNGFILEMN